LPILEPYARLAPLLLIASLPLINGPAAAQTDAAKLCARISSDTARLACYDAAYGHPTTGAETTAKSPPTPVATPSNTVERFGDDGQLQNAATAALPKNLNAQIVELTSLAHGLYRLGLDNQQTWQTTQADWAVDFKIGDRVIITRMALHGYQLSRAGDARSVGARRLQ